MGVLPTNTLLVQLTFTFLCALCYDDEETISPLFCDCTKAQTLLYNLTEFKYTVM